MKTNKLLTPLKLLGVFLCMLCLSLSEKSFGQDCCAGYSACMSHHIPSPFVCVSCVTAHNCLWVHISNAGWNTGCDICEVKLTITKDPGSQSFSICDPFTNWGDCDHRTLWAASDENSNLYSLGSCYSWGSATSHVIDFGSPSSSICVGPGQHFTVTICGAATISARVYFNGGASYCDLGAISVNDNDPPNDCGNCNQQDCDCIENDCNCP